MNHNIPLSVLDTYARTISSKQSNMLYETKCNKKYKKKLYENMKYQNDDSYSLFLSNYTLDENNSSVEQALLKYVNKNGLQYNVISEGVYFYTPFIDNYLSLLEDLEHDGFDKKILNELADPSLK